MLFRHPGADQREALECDDSFRFSPLRKVLILVLTLGLGFASEWARPPIADQREAWAATDHAVYLGWKLWKSLRLARCISRAASVSDWVWTR
jgi:hypothetical protein